ncbi:MAG: hypothetical protein COA62_03705 [Rhodobiaceae bacterium]|nr:MAG: hypothetical protein COA62_03705 [Rhodobiaceae bacterium]
MTRTRIIIGLLVAVTFQTAILTQMVWAQITLLRSPTEVVLESAPVDPRDLFRGDYVILNYAIASLEYGEIPIDETLRTGDDAYVVLKITSPYATPFRVLTAYPDNLGDNETAIKGRVSQIQKSFAERECTRCQIIHLSYPLDNYFVPEGTGSEIEEYRNERALGVIVALNGEGDAAIKGLMMDGEKIYDTPLF